MFGDMSPLCNGPAAIYHSLSSLKGRLDLDEHKEYEDDLVWAPHTHEFGFFSLQGEIMQQHIVSTPLREFESAFFLH